MSELNPEGWTSNQWRAFIARMRLDGGYAKRVDSLVSKRLDWVNAEVARQSEAIRMTSAFKAQLRRDLLCESRKKIPNPDPLSDGWEPPKQFKVGDSIAREM
jgi:hypothetical protein